MFRKFFDKLAGAVKRAWNWLKGTRPAKFIARCYDRAVLATARPVLWTAYGGPRRVKVFGTKVGTFLVRLVWEAILAPTTVGFMVWEGLKALRRPVRAVARGVVTAAGYAWAGITMVWTVEVGLYYWFYNNLGHALVRSAQWCYHKLAGTPAMPRRISRYITLREAMATEFALLVWVHAGLLRICRRAIGDTHTWRVVQFVTDNVARLHAPTYDRWFDKELPYGTPQDGGETYALHIVDGETVLVEEPISEKEKTENWFVSNDYLLIATDAPDKSDRDVFNEYMRERWANLNAADIATDEYGRTWVVPLRGQPLFKDVATTTEAERMYADLEMGWLTESDKVTKSALYGRHWAAALADQDPKFLADEDTRRKERAFMHSKLKGRDDLHIEHVLRGFDEWCADHSSVPAH